MVRKFAKEIAKDVFTLPNAISLVGYAAVQFGIKQGVDTKKGVALIGVGRTLDVVDGWVARALGQTSQFGALLDAALDKKGMLDIHEALKEKDMLKPHLSDAFTAQSIANGTLTSIDKILHPSKEFAPSVAGKHAMAEMGLYFGSAMLAPLIEQEGFEQTAHVIESTGLGLGYDSAYRNGPQATKGYALRLLSKQ